MEKKLLWRLGSFSIYLLSNCAELSTTYMVPTYVVCTHNHYLVFWRLSFKIRLCISLHVYVSSMNVSAYIMLVFSIIVELKDQIQKENIMEMFSHLSLPLNAKYTLVFNMFIKAWIWIEKIIVIMIIYHYFLKQIFWANILIFKYTEP